jgi:hypothetical protein
MIDIFYPSAILLAAHANTRLPQAKGAFCGLHLWVRNESSALRRPFWIADMQVSLRYAHSRFSRIKGALQNRALLIVGISRKQVWVRGRE